MLKKIWNAWVLLASLLFASQSAVAQMYEAQGKASYYANKFHGRLTSSGEVFSQDSLTCAHRTLPFGTYLKVKNQNNGKEVVVRVTDRGPFIQGRIVDLSRAAAEQIGMIRAGVVRVDVVQVENPESLDSLDFELPLFRMYDALLEKCYTLEEWSKQREYDCIAMLAANIKDTLRNYIAELTMTTED